jgi:hypothetical protein
MNKQKLMYYNYFLILDDYSSIVSLIVKFKTLN